MLPHGPAKFPKSQKCGVCEEYATIGATCFGPWYVHKSCMYAPPKPKVLRIQQIPQLQQKWTPHNFSISDLCTFRKAGKCPCCYGLAYLNALDLCADCTTDEETRLRNNRNT